MSLIRRNRADIFSAAAILLCSIFVSLQSYFSILNPVAQGYDATVYSYVGWSMTKGYVPYVDSWDNKGPLFHIIQYIGSLIHMDHGLFLLEILSLFLAFWFLYQTAKLYVSPFLSAVAALYCNLLLVPFLEGGNLSEEYALPFLAAAIYLLTKYLFQDHRLYWYQTMLIGACTAACGLLRVNLMAPLLVYCGILFLHTLFMRKWKNALLLLPQFLTGFAAAVLPLAIYLAANHALKACIDAAYVMCFKTDYYSWGERIQNAYHVMTTANGMYGLMLMAAFIICTLGFVAFRHQMASRVRISAICVSCAFVLNVFANMISGEPFRHYFMSNIPLFILPAAFAVYLIWRLIHEAFRRLEGRWNLAGGNTAAIAAVFVLCFVSWNHIDTNVDLIFTRRNTVNTQETALVDYIGRTTKEDDRIQVYGAFNNALQYNSRRLAASRYFYSPVWPIFRDDLIAGAKRQIGLDIQEKSPVLVFLQKDMEEDLFRQAEGLEDYMNNHYQPVEDIQSPQYHIYRYQGA